MASNPPSDTAAKTTDASATTSKPATAKPAAKKSAARKSAPKSATPKAAKPRKESARKAPTSANTAQAKAKFAKAIEEARAGAQALTKEAQAKAGVYRDQLTNRSSDWAEDAKDMAGQAKVRAGELAAEGKAKTSDALASLGKIVGDNAKVIDDKLGARYGDYARTAARSMQETAAKIEAKDLNELADDTKQFVRKSPGLALGIAALAGFVLSRVFKGSSASD